MDHAAVIALIYQLAVMNGVEPKVAMAVAEVESNFIATKTGDAGEIGMFQVMPANVPTLSEKKLFNPGVNAALGLALLAEAKRTCPHQKDYTWLVCYNLGLQRAKKVKHPTMWPYYKKVIAKMQKYSSDVAQR